VFETPHLTLSPRNVFDLFFRSAFAEQALLKGVGRDFDLLILPFF